MSNPFLHLSSLTFPTQTEHTETSLYSTHDQGMKHKDRGR